MENNILVLKTYVDGGINDTPFPNLDNPIEIGVFRYDAKRMGGAPIITASVNYPSCLDNEWTDKVYAKFRGEKYYLKQTPTSSYSNEDARYKHDIELVSERVILDNVYFFDAVVGNPQGEDKPVSNSTKVVFFGGIKEFARRMNASLEYSKLLKWVDGVDEEGNPIKVANGYNIVVDNDEAITTEEKLMSFEDQFFSNVLQEIYNVFKVPYYFVGKTIHIGFASDLENPPTFAYGVDDALLSITKNNANFKVVNRVTGTGSSDNIPFYYPNNSPKGDVEAITNREDLEVKIVDPKLFSDKVEVGKEITYHSASCSLNGVEFNHVDNAIINEYFNTGFYGIKGLSGKIKVGVSSIGNAKVRINVDVKNITNHKGESVAAISNVKYSFGGNGVYKNFGISDELFFDKIGEAFVYFDISIHVTDALGATLELLHYADIKVTVTIEEANTWSYDGKSYKLNDLGLDIASGVPQYGDAISQEISNYIKTSQTLMPSIYRETNGDERFYNATNGVYDGWEFKNPYIEGRPKEHIITVEDIKPTIKDVKVVQPEGSTFAGFTLNSDMFTEFAYDRDDNDETEEGENESSRDFKHSYFFGKLRVLDFNLFDHAIENQPMTISFTSGDCGACNFTIGVTEELPQKNPVQVDEDGNLIYDEKTGNVVCTDVSTFQERQQDTSKYEVWIALKKEEETYGILMPKAPKFDENGEQIEAPHRPKACTINEDGTPNNDGDTFVILGINLPKSYIINAEKKLEDEIIKYLKENNEEKFTFSIGFSRIYFEENPDMLQYLNENSRFYVTYNNKNYLLYVTSYSYQMSEGDILPQITVELDENLIISQNAIQNAISEVRSEVSAALSNIDVLAMASPFFMRKDIDDVVNGRPNFAKGLKFGEGGKVEVMDNNSAKLTIEYLEVTKKASFTSLEIKEKTHVGGQIIISPAAMTCGEVEELSDAYRCYFQTRGEDNTDEIFNQFAINDLAICQTYNAWGSRYYWRKVVGIGNDYIDLSKTLCDEDSDIPMSGDKIIQLGNTEDATRQAAQVLSAYGEDAPSFIMYNGINDFSLVDKNITGIIWNPETQEPQMYSYGSFFFGDRELNDNFITFQKKEGDTEKTLSIKADVTIGANSSGLTNLSEWKDAEQSISSAQTAAKEAQSNASEAKRVAAATSVIIEEWSSDGIISPVEKQALRNELASVLSDYEDIQKQYEKYIQEFEDLILIDGKYYITEDGYEFNVEVAYEDWEAFKVAKNAYVAELESKINTEGNVEVGDLTVKQETYYSTKTTILEDIALSIKADADDSKQQARQAQESVDNVHDTLDSWTADGVISPIEKQALRNEKAQVYNEYDSIYNDVVRYQIENQLWEEYETQYSLYLQEIERAITLDEVISAEALTSRQTSYYQARTEILDAIESAAKSKVDGMEYLTKLFGKGNNLSVTGGVLAQMLAVSNEDNEVEAFINGSDVGKDGEHGKLLLAAGIDDITKPEEAKTRVYEDGHIESNDITLRDGCTIGDSVKIEGGGMAIRETSEDGTTSVTTIGNSGIYHTNTLSGKQPSSAGFSSCGYYVLEAVANKAVLSCHIPFKESINDNRDGTPMYAAAMLECPNGYSVYSPSGQFAGLRPKCRTVNTSTYLDDFDHTIIIDASEYVAIHLPNNPKDGQEYVILCKSTKSIGIMSEDKDIYSLVEGRRISSGSADYFTSETRRHITLVYSVDIDEWIESYQQYE